MLNSSYEFDRQKKRIRSFCFLILSILPLWGLFFLEERKVYFDHFEYACQKKSDKIEEPSVYIEKKQLKMDKLKSLKVLCLKNRPDRGKGNTYLIEEVAGVFPLELPSKYYINFTPFPKLGYLPSDYELEISQVNDDFIALQKFNKDAFPLATYSLESSITYQLPVEAYHCPELEKSFPFSKILQGKYWGLDEVSRLMGKHLGRYEVEGQSFLIKVEDRFVFDGFKWLKNASQSENRPLCQINSIKDTLDLDIWDETGNKWLRTSISKINLSNSKFLDLKMLDIYLRSGSKISLVLDKQKIFIDEGQWLVLQNGKWLTVEKKDLTENFSYDRYLYLEKIDLSLKGKELTFYQIDKARQHSQKLQTTFSKGSFSNHCHKKLLQARGTK